MKEGDSRGLSPVIATVLLIAMVVVIALIVFLWFRGITGDYGEKFGKNVELVCQEVVISADYDSSDGIIYITNDGNVPIFSMDVKTSGAGSHTTADITTLVTNWPKNGLNAGEPFSGEMSAGSAEKITLIPILLGVSEKENKKTFECGETYGYEITISQI